MAIEIQPFFNPLNLINHATLNFKHNCSLSRIY